MTNIQSNLLSTLNPFNRKTDSEEIELNSLYHCYSTPGSRIPKPNLGIPNASYKDRFWFYRKATKVPQQIDIVLRH